MLLQHIITVLDAEKQELVRQETALLSALSPFNFLPDELVAQILVYASRYIAEDTTYMIHGAPEPASNKLLRQFPFSLLTICRRWYQIASSTPCF